MEHMPAGLRVKGDVVVRSIDKISAFVPRYGLILVVFCIGCLEFTGYESRGVFKHASHSPLLAWAYHILDVRDFSRGLGVVEIAIASLIPVGPVWPKLSIVGSLGGIGMFFNYVEFCHYDARSVASWVRISCPRRVSRPVPSQDVVLFGAAIWTLADSLRCVANGNGSAPQTS